MRDRNNRARNNNEMTMGMVVSNSIGMALLTLTRNYSGDLPTEERFEEEYAACCISIFDGIQQDDPRHEDCTYIINKTRESDNVLDRVTLFIPSVAGVANDQGVIYVFPLKKVLTLVWKALHDDEKYTQNYVGTEDQNLLDAHNDRVHRLATFYGCLKELRSERVCHHGIRNALVATLDKKYRGISIIVDPEDVILTFLRENINAKFWSAYNSNADIGVKRGLTRALFTWMSSDSDGPGPALLLQNIDPNQTFRHPLHVFFISHGINPSNIQSNDRPPDTITGLDNLINQRLASVDFSCNPEEYPALDAIHRIFCAVEDDESDRAMALLRVKAWLHEDNFEIDNPLHKKTVVDFDCIYHTHKTLVRYQLMLIATGSITEDNFDSLFVRCKNYLREWGPLTISTVQDDIVNKCTLLRTAVNQCNDSTAFDAIENFFARWFFAQKDAYIEASQRLYSLLLDPIFQAKVKLDDAWVERFMRHMIGCDLLLMLSAPNESTTFTGTNSAFVLVQPIAGQAPTNLYFVDRTKQSTDPNYILNIFFPAGQSIDAFTTAMYPGITNNVYDNIVNLSPSQFQQVTLISGHTYVSSRDITIYQINRIFLHAITRNPFKENLHWSNLFVELFTVTLEFVKNNYNRAPNSASAIALKRDTHTPELIAQLEYLLRRHNEYGTFTQQPVVGVRLNNPGMMILLPEDVVTFDELFRVANLLTSYQRNEHYYPARVFIDRLLNTEMEGAPQDQKFDILIKALQILPLRVRMKFIKPTDDNIGYIPIILNGAQIGQVLDCLPDTDWQALLNVLSNERIQTIIPRTLDCLLLVLLRLPESDRCSYLVSIRQNIRNIVADLEKLCRVLRTLPEADREVFLRRFGDEELQGIMSVWVDTYLVSIIEMLPRGYWLNFVARLNPALGTIIDDKTGLAKLVGSLLAALPRENWQAIVAMLEYEQFHRITTQIDSCKYIFCEILELLAESDHMYFFSIILNKRIFRNSTITDVSVQLIIAALQDSPTGQYRLTDSAAVQEFVDFFRINSTRTLLEVNNVLDVLEIWILKNRIFDELLVLDRYMWSISPEGVHREIDIYNYRQHTCPFVDGLRQYRVEVSDDLPALYHILALSVGMGREVLKNQMAYFLLNRPDEYFSIVQTLTQGRVFEEYRGIVNDIQFRNEPEVYIVMIAILMRVLNRPIIVIGPDRRIMDRVGRSQLAEGEDPIFIFCDENHHFSGLIREENMRANEVIQRLQNPIISPVLQVGILRNGFFAQPEAVQEEAQVNNSQFLPGVQ